MLQIALEIIEMISSIALCVAMSTLMLPGIVLYILSFGNTRWTNHGVNLFSPYPPQVWDSLGVITELETGKVRTLARIARMGMLAVAATIAARLVVQVVVSGVS